MSDKYAIQVKGVHKSFRLPHEKHSSLKSVFVHMFRRSRRYEKQNVLQGIDIEVKKGEFFGIVGRNGSGKSTLLKLLAGIYMPNKGSIEVNGTLTPFIELGVGFNHELTGRENVFLNGALLGFSRKEMLEMYDEIVDFAELHKFMDQKLKNYSSGMQVRLAFAIAIRAKTDILLIDEVLAVGDLKFQEKCFNFFEDIKGKRTVIFISHDMKSVERFCDRVMILEKSKIVDIGKPQDMIFKYGALMSNEQFTISQKNKKESGVHLGSGAVAIKKVEVLVDGKPVASVPKAKEFSLRVSFDAKEDIAEPALTVSIFNKDNIKVFSTNSEKDTKVQTAIRTGKGTFEIACKQNPLVPGAYKINAGVFSKGLTFAYDHFRDAANFRVIGTTRPEHIVELPVEWSVRSKKG